MPLMTGSMRFAVALLLAYTINAEIATENDVLVLTDENFDIAIGSNDFVMVEFYAPWCGHCKALAPEWDIAAAELKNHSIKLAKVDTSDKACEGVTRRYMISGFPTIYFFKYQNKLEYNEARDAEKIVSWALRHSGPSATVLTSVDQIGIAKKNFDVLVVGYFPDPSSSLVKSLYAVADAKESIKMFVTHSKEIAAHLGLRKEKDALVVLKEFDEGRADLELSSIDPPEAFDRMLSFVKANTYPLVSVFYNRDAQKIFSPRITTHALLFTDAEADHHIPAVALATEMARELRGQVQFINILAEDAAKLQFFEVDKESLPVVIGVDVDEMERFPFAGPFQQSSKSAIVKHLRQVLNRELFAN